MTRARRFLSASYLGWIIFLSAAGLPQTSPAQATDPDLQYYKEPGIYPTRSYLNQHFNENVDPFTGRLQLHYVDLYIPGNGGFDLEITRSYTSVDDSINSAATPTPFGLGWTMHFGRVLRRSDIALCDVNQAQGSRMPVLELQNGSRYILFRDDFTFPNTGAFMTTARWRAECMNAGAALRVFAPNGTRYEMTQIGNAPSGQTAWYTTRIIDRNGNSMTITYNTNLGGNVVPSNISTSDGRSVTFNYTGTGAFTSHLTSITDGTRTWTYTLQNLTNNPSVWLLKQVTPPAGGSWVYAYKEVFDGASGLFSIKTLTYPQGGTINYLYNTTAFTAGAPGSVPNTVVTQKTTSGDVSSAAGTWTFSYSPSTGFGVNDTTTANTPSGTITYRHIGYNTVGVGTYWKFGLLVSKDIGSEQSEAYTWTNQTISNQTNTRPGSSLAADQTANAPLLSQKQITRNGNPYTTSYSVFDSFGNPATVIESSTNFSRTKSLTYQNNTTAWIIHQLKDESFDGFAINRIIDPKGNITQETKFGVVTNYTPDTQGNLQTRTNARGIPTNFLNYFRGIPQLENHPENVSVSRVVSTAGDVTSETDGKGDQMGYAYDGLNRLAGSPAINFPRAGAADVSIVWATTTQTVTRGTLTQTVTFDGFGRVRSVAKTDSVLLPTGQPASGNSNVTFRYDALGRRTFQSYPNSSAGITYTYDILDRVKTVKHDDDTPSGALRSYNYGATSVDLVNERGKTHSFDYKAFGDPDQRWLVGIRVTSQPSVNISFPRNSIGQILSVAQGPVTRTYDYYPANRFLKSISDPETGLTVFGRDAVGNMSSRQVGASPVTNYTYDGLNRLTNIDYPAPTSDVTKSYYKDGLLMDVTNGSTSRHFDYDPDKNLTLERLIVDGITYEINHTYNPNDGRDTTTYPSGTVVTYTANGFGLPTRASPFLTTVDFHPTGEVKRLDYANGVTTSISLTGRQWPKELGSSRSAVNLVDIQYAYDGVGNVTRFDDFIDTTNTIPTLGYDDIDRLFTASSNVESRTFGYDGVGNLTSQTFGAAAMTYNYDATNRLTGITGAGGARSYTFSYDIYGNVASNGTQSFIYNDARQMNCARCGQPDESAYLYDGLDMRVRARKNGLNTYFMYGLDGNLLFESTPQTSGGSVEKKDYVYVSGKQVAVKTTSQVMSTVTPPPGTVSGASGSPVTLTVTVGGSSPTGTVTFMEGGTVLGTGPASVVNGSASITLSNLSVGSHTITAVYSGDANNTASNATFTVNIFDLSWLPAILELLLDD